MAIETVYTEWLLDVLAPPWMHKRRWREFLAVAADAMDSIVEGSKDAVKARFAEIAPVDALPLIGSERMLEQYPSEPIETYRTRLVAAWELYEFQGTSSQVGNQDPLRGVKRGLVDAGFPNVEVYDVHAGPGWAGSWPPTSTVANWSRFWVDIDPPFSVFDWTAVKYGLTPTGSGRRYGPTADVWTWGSTATPDQVAFVRRLIRKWKPAHTVCETIFVHLPDSGPILRWPGMI